MTNRRTMSTASDSWCFGIRHSFVIRASSFVIPGGFTVLNRKNSAPPIRERPDPIPMQPGAGENGDVKHFVRVDHAGNDHRPAEKLQNGADGIGDAAKEQWRHELESVTACDQRP